MSDIRFNQWLHQSGTGGITQVDGGHVGIGTTNPDVAVHTANNKKVNVGIVTANSVYAGNFYGSGANLTGIVGGATGVDINDNVKVRLGTGNDCELYHNGTDTYIANATNNFRIGNTGSTNLKFFTNNSTRWNIDGSGHFVPDTDSQVDIGTNSVRVRNIYADTLYGDGSNLTGITGTTINNNADNRLITGSGTANTLNGESGLTYDGSDLVVTGDGVSEIKIADDGDSFLGTGGSVVIAKGYFDYSGSVTGFYTNNAGQGVIGTKTNQEFHFIINNTKKLSITQNGYLVPAVDNSIDLGSTSLRWRNLYTTDLHLSNKGKTNEVDETWGDWTLQEGEDKIFMINNRTGKKYSLKMEEE